MIIEKSSKNCPISISAMVLHIRKSTYAYNM
jgi:hypothetical protein